MSWTLFNNTDATLEQAQSFGAALTALQAFHDAFVEAAPDAATLDALTTDLERWTDVLTPLAQPEARRLSGRIPTLPSRGHAALPPVHVDASDPDRITATLTFGSYFMGGGGAAHGGMIMTVLDEIMGMQATITDQKLARTAYLKVDFRSPVPIDVPVQVTSWREGRDGRKHFIRAEMWAGETLCAEGDALFVELR